MAERKHHVDQLQGALNKIIDDFVVDCQLEVDKALEASAKVGKEEVKKEPAGAGKYHDWDDYEKGWVVEKEVFAFGPHYIIRNKKKPGLTHLLEKGHVNVDGSRARAFPHVEPAAEEAVKDLIRRLTTGDI